MIGCGGEALIVTVVAADGFEVQPATVVVTVYVPA